jgi:hypothetical protein
MPRHFYLGLRLSYWKLSLEIFMTPNPAVDPVTATLVHGLTMLSLIEAKK